MELYGKQSKSIPQKILIHVIEILLLYLSFWILFQKGGDFFADKLHISNAAENVTRRNIIFIFNIVIFTRIGYAMLFLLKRKIPWEESIGVPMAFAVYYIGFSLLVLPSSGKTDILDYLGIAVFAVGCIINTLSEILRAVWKKDSSNKGKLYTGGLFAYSRHINYFGDLLWATGYAIITGNIYAAAIPVLLFFFFAFFNAPKLDKHLKNKYGADYDKYAAKTKMLIPFIY